MEEGKKSAGLSTGLASILSDTEQNEISLKTHLVSNFDDIGHQSIERTIEYILSLPNKSIGPNSGSVDVNFIRSNLKKQIKRLAVEGSVNDINRDGICVLDYGFGSNIVSVDNTSICGEIKKVREPLLVESLAVFSSARANACMWKGKWMYEVTLETAGVQQLGWATISCPFTDRKGVGDAEDSYAFDGRRVSKWNKESSPYGQPWIIGDVIGCCIDLNQHVISFYRNGVSLGVAFEGIRKLGPGHGYYPAFSLSEGESCELNFGSRSFKYPVDGFLAIQAPPSSGFASLYLLQCLSRMLEVHHLDKSDSAYFERLRSLKRFTSIQELYYPISHGICEELFEMIQSNEVSCEYIAWSVLLPFLKEVFRSQPLHDYAGLDMVISLLSEFREHVSLFQNLIMALSFSCKTAPLVLVDCPYSGSYPYLSLVCHLLRHKDIMNLWWQSPDFQSSLEGFLSRKSPNKQDLQFLIPSVWWPGSVEDIGSENSMILTIEALNGAVNKIEEMQRELCSLVIQFIPPTTPSQLPGSVFRTFVQNLILKASGVEHKMSPSDASSNSTLVSLYTVILYFLSEGFPMDDIYGLMGSAANAAAGGFLHRGGKRNFPLGLLLNADLHRSWFPGLEDQQTTC
ncbi:hypothetical protein HPP92_016847 [Vanilla planifolia]|uniref:B30.2/SPRY domain-containing protein n=1 Tax=Vanilla planifolia TaxID=51239 RepID=A0A835QJN0_VANPL|nr:hypothetical protein HPP92_016847 [Vanilla planifolia]